MRQKTRPFVVELKRKRAVRQNRSIWGDVDLSAIAGEAIATPSTAEPAVAAPPGDRRPSALDGGIAPPVAEAAGEADRCPETHEAGVADEVERVETPTDDRTPRRAARVRRRPERALPRGERWKLRLPKVLRDKR
ncbi:hypothetical protein [Mesorhizobium sp. WSM2239]|uniref:Transposase n=2 Tax=unclassified Mesorhizobium TaxID=325217 RepID=A0AAU8DI09_9HYPH